MAGRNFVLLAALNEKELIGCNRPRLRVQYQRPPECRFVSSRRQARFNKVFDAMRLRYLWGVVLLVAAGFGWSLLPRADAQAGKTDPKMAAAAVAFDKVIVPFVARHCVACHGPEKKKANLALHTYKDVHALLKGRKVW